MRSIIDGSGVVGGIIIAAAVVLSAGGAAAAAEDFYAYYTSLEYDQPYDGNTMAAIPASALEVFRSAGAAEAAVPVEMPAGGAPKPQAVRWGKYADLVVNLSGQRKLVFSRATGYLPYLQTPKGRFPLKPLVECKPDPMCLCSYVRLIDANAQRIVVHWRHVPDPASVVMTEVVHEIFTVTPDCRLYRTVRVGTKRPDSFSKFSLPTILAWQNLALSDDGLNELALMKPKPWDKQAPAATGSPIRTPAGGSPTAWWKFDDGIEPIWDEAAEAVSTIHCPVAGNKALWKKGVSGTALAFDGYFSKVTLPKDKAPKVTNELTAEAWVALGAYPWNDAGIVHCASGEPISAEEYKHGYRDPYTYRPWKMKGYLLGVDPYGRPIFKVNGEQVGGGELAPKDLPRKADILPTYRWAHLAGTYGGGKMCLYVDGKLVASKEASGPIAVPDRGVTIGLNGDPQRISDPVSHSKFAANNNMALVYGIEGLIDEVRLFTRTLSADEVRKSYEAMRPSAEALAAPDLEKRILPGGGVGKPAEKFGAEYRTLKFHELWDNLWRPSEYRDIVVRFDTLPTSVVFWQGTNFGSGWVTENNKWMSDQSWEIGGPHGCAEHMADKRGRFDHVRLIENTDARVVVHWRYASVDVGYVFGRTGVWADEYMTIYPDGVGVRNVEGIGGGWQDTQFLSQPGTTCLDNVELTALTVANLAGETADLTWQPPNRVPNNPIADALVKRINFKSKWKVFAAYRTGAKINQWGGSEQSKHTPDPFAGPWNHWPVGLNPSDGRYAVSDDRVTHAAIGGADNTGSLIMYGFADGSAAAMARLVRLAASWNSPPAIGGAAGCQDNGYDPAQRAYRLAATGGDVSFTLQGSKDSPVYNPCFVISNWHAGRDARVSIAGRTVEPGKALRQGIIRDTDGKPAMVIWLELESASPVKFTVSPFVVSSLAPSL
jgi:hypothetical protein